MVFLIFSIGMTAGGSRFFRELVPPEMKKQAGKEVQITGQVYQIEVRESYQILYLILSKKTSRILVYDDAKQPVQIGNKVNVKGELSLFEEARNPGNFDQKFYYEKQKIGAFLWAEALRVTDRESNPLKQGLYELRQKWKRILIDAAGEDGQRTQGTVSGKRDCPRVGCFGASSVVPWCGSLSSPAKNHGLVYRGRACGHIIFVCLYFDDRDDGFGVSGNGDVFVSHRSRSFRQTL